MQYKKLMFGAAVAATIALVFPAHVQAITSTTAVTALGQSTPKTTMQATDQIDAKVSAENNFDVSMQVSRAVTRSTLGMTWSGESLQLLSNDSSRVKSPEGWGLEYTTNGTTWSSTKPSSYTSITGVRSNGTYTKTDSNKFQSSTTATLLANATDFSGGAGGDGFNLTFVGDRVYNVFHHGGTIILDCHLKASGSSCYGAPKEFIGYQTPNSSHAWVNAAGNKLFVPVYNPSDANSFGVTCIDLATRTNPVLCTTPYVGLADTNGKQNMATTSQVGQKIYMPNPYDWKLYCYDMATALECSGSGYTTGGFAMQHTATVSSSSIFTAYGRSSAIGGKIFWTSDTYIGCYDPATGSACAGSSPVAIGVSIISTTGNYSNKFLGVGVGYQFPMFPVRNSSNALIGACYYASAQCFSPLGISDDSILPLALKSWMKEHPVPHWTASDAGEFGEYDNKIYFPVGPNTAATNDVYCFDYDIGDACLGFAGIGLGSRIYSIQADPDSQQPNCMWTNGDAGKITTFNATTGEKGCANASSTVRFKSENLAPRLSCLDADHISAWGVVQFYSPGISASVLRVTVNDAAGSPIANFNDIQITVDPNSDVRGTLDLSTIPASTRPTILVTATITVAGSILSDITATVGYSASDPQLCVQLLAKVKCVTAYTPPTPTSVGDGLINTIASREVTNYDVSNAQISYGSETETIANTMTGTGDVVCPAVYSGGGGGGVLATPVATAPVKKRPPVTITISGFRDGSPVLTKTIQNRIKAFLKKYNDYPVIETAGYTEGPVVLRADFALSKARAINANKYIKTNLKKKFSIVKVKSDQDKLEASKVRRIKITLSDE